jgi:hypothetical protein
VHDIGESPLLAGFFFKGHAAQTAFRIQFAKKGMNRVFPFIRVGKEKVFSKFLQRTCKLGACDEDA